MFLQVLGIVTEAKKDLDLIHFFVNNQGPGETFAGAHEADQKEWYDLD